jgi:phosphoglycolate phosphatase
MLQVITYNIHFGEKLSQITIWIKENTKFDIICFQEFPKSKIDIFIKELNKFGSFSFHFATGFIREHGEYGELTLYNSKKIKVLGTEVIKLGSSIVERRIHKDKLGRSSLVTILESDSKKFVLVNSHLACLSFNGFRIKQLLKIINRLDKIAPLKDSPIIVLGDFNYSSLSRRKKLIQFMANYGFLNAYKKHTHRLFYLKHQLDYVFYKYCYIDRIQVNKLPYSDHSCITFTLNFEPKTVKKIAIFDFDGTIANTIPTDLEIAKLFNQFTKEFNIEKHITVEDIKQFRGKSLKEIVKALHIRFYRLPFILRKVQKFMQPDLLKANPIGGIKDAINKLKENGYILGIVTSSKKTLVENFLKRHKINGFDFIHSGSSLFGKHRIINKLLKKYGFSQEDTIYIGDEIRDIEATKKSEIPIISVTWGFNSKAGLKKYLPHFMVEKPSDIVKILT